MSLLYSVSALVNSGWYQTAKRYESQNEKFSIPQTGHVISVGLQLYICDAAMDNNVFTGEKFTCPEGEMVVVDIANGNPFNYTCVDRTLREYNFAAF